MTDDAWRERRQATLDIAGPTAVCGACGFQVALEGSWSVEDGRLVWRADADPQRRRGPNLWGCGEHWSCPEEFQYVEVDDKPLNAEQISALRATAEEAT